MLDGIIVHKTLLTTNRELIMICYFIRNFGLAQSGLCIALAVGGAGFAYAQTTPGSQDPGTTGQRNQCWGNVASQLAQLGSNDNIAGGGMGSHSRSGTAAEINGGFANGIIPIPQPRNGVANQTREFHGTEPGDGGNGVHANNNALATRFLDPVTGQRSDGTTNVLTPCIP